MLSILYGIAPYFVRLPNLSYLQPSSVIVTQNSFELRWLPSEYIAADRPDLAVRAIPATVTLYVSEPKDDDDCLSPPFRQLCETYTGYRNGTVVISATVYGSKTLPKMLRSGPMNLYYAEGEAWVIEATCVPDIPQGCSKTKIRFSTITILQELQWFYQNAVEIRGRIQDFELYRVAITGEWEEEIPGLPPIPCAECQEFEDITEPIKFVQCDEGECRPVTIGYNEYAEYIFDEGCDGIPVSPPIKLPCPPGTLFTDLGIPCQPLPCPPGYALFAGLCVRRFPIPPCPPGYVREAGVCIPFIDNPVEPPLYPDPDLPAPPGYDPYPPNVRPYPCPLPYYWDGSQCRLRDPCPNGGTWDGTQCRTNLCPPGQIFINGRCSDDFRCPNGTKLVRGVCEPSSCGPCQYTSFVDGSCIDRECPGDKRLNPQTCECYCPQCPPGCTQLNDLYCTCDCPPEPFPGCPPNKCFDGRFCIKCNNPCKPNEMWDGNICTPICGDCEELNEEYECELPECPTGYSYCGDCTCCRVDVCPTGYKPCGPWCCPPQPDPTFPCPPGTILDGSGRCVSPPCQPGPGEYYDSILNDCVCLPCKYGLTSTPTCGCEGSPCPPGVAYDADIGRCECPPGQVFNGSSCSDPPGSGRELPKDDVVCTTWVHKFVYADPSNCSTKQGILAVTNDRIDATNGVDYRGFWCGWNHFGGFNDTQGRFWSCNPYCAFAGGFKFKERWCKNGNPCVYGCRKLKLVFIEPFPYSFDWEGYRFGRRTLVNMLFPDVIREFSIPTSSCTQWSIEEQDFGILGSRIYYVDPYGKEYLGTAFKSPLFNSRPAYHIIDSSFCPGCTTPCGSDSKENGWFLQVSYSG